MLKVQHSWAVLADKPPQYLVEFREVPVQWKTGDWGGGPHFQKARNCSPVVTVWDCSVIQLKNIPCCGKGRFPLSNLDSGPTYLGEDRNRPVEGYVNGGREARERGDKKAQN